MIILAFVLSLMTASTDTVTPIERPIHVRVITANEGTIDYNLFVPSGTDTNGVQRAVWQDKRNNPLHQWPADVMGWSIDTTGW